jgi:serine/threonine-protein kinase
MAAVAFVAAPSGKQQLYVRELDAAESRALPGADGAEGPFFSPDGRMLGFWTEETVLKRVSISGGAPELVCKGQTHIHGGSWCRDGTVAFSTKRKIWTVPASGGEPKEVTAPPEGESRQYFPEILPGCRTVLYSVVDGQSAPVGIVGQSLETGRRVTLVKGGSNAHFAPPGHLLYVVNGSLMAAPFDSGSLSLTGPAVRVLDGVAYGAPQERALGQFSASATGTLAFVAGPSFSSGKGELLWVERDGTETPIKEVGIARGARLSPDGRRIAYQFRDESVAGAMPSVWVYDLERGTTSRVTFEGEWWPVWTPDGRRIVFIHSTDQKSYALAWQSADGTGPLEIFSAVPGRVRQPQSWTPDGGTLLVHDFPWPSPSSGTSGFDIVGIPRDGERTAKPLLASSFTESLPFVSPDGRWLAYVSDESGRSEVYVRPYPSLDAK